MTDRSKLKIVIVHFCCMFAAAALFEVFFVLCLWFFRGTWNNAVWCGAFAAGTLLNAGLLAADLIFFLLKKPVVYKSCIIAYVFLVFAAVVAYALFETGFAEVIRDQANLEAYLERAGNWMSVLFVTLQFLQVVVLPIPSTVTVVAGTALFGAAKGSLYSLLGIVIGSIVAFFVGRYAGSRVVAWMVGKDALDKWLKKIKGKDKLLLTAMFLLPVFPDDVLCFVAGLSTMSFPYFLAVIIISRVLAIFSTSYSVTLIPFDTWWGILIWCILIAFIAALFVVLYKKSDAILGWFEKLFHRETRVEQKKQRNEFTLEVVDADGSSVKKGVKKQGDGHNGGSG